MGKGKIQEIITAHEKEIEKLKQSNKDTREVFEKQRRFIEDVVEGFGRQNHPGTELCGQCRGAGGGWRKYHLTYQSFYGQYVWWECGLCEGTGRVPIEKRKR